MAAAAAAPPDDDERDAAPEKGRAGREGETREGQRRQRDGETGVYYSV